MNVFALTLGLGISACLVQASFEQACFVTNHLELLKAAQGPSSHVADQMNFSRGRRRVANGFPRMRREIPEDAMSHF